MNDKKYFKFPLMWVIILVFDLSVIILSLFLVRWQTAGVVWGIIFSLELFMVILPMLSWPVIKDEGLEIRWMLPEVKKSFLYDDIKSVIFKRSGTYYSITVVGSDGKRKYWGYMKCLPVGKLQEFLDDLRAHGVEVDNRLNFTDVI